MSEIAFYQSHLDRVSRSFAFCIARLDGEMREWVSLSYLLCRLLDTVEDAPWPSTEKQAEAFDRFAEFLWKEPSAREVSDWAAGFGQVGRGEKSLLGDSHRCFANLHRLAPGPREQVQRCVRNMYRGMRYFLREHRGSGVLRLRDLAEVNQYCFFVAGLVGELLTDLLAQRGSGARPGRQAHLDACHFGLFLQKINLLKDQAEDEREGRYLVPSRAALVASLRENAEGALRYLQSLPLAERGFRLFCAWSLFLGLASLPWIERSSILGFLTKIPRTFTETLLGKVERLIDDNQALVRLFAEMMPKFAAPPPGTPPVGLLRMDELYQGALGPAEFRQLGLSS